MKIIFAFCLLSAGCASNHNADSTAAYEHELAQRALRESHPVTQFPIPPGHPSLTADGLIDLRAIARRP